MSFIPYVLLWLFDTVSRAVCWPLCALCGASGKVCHCSRVSWINTGHHREQWRCSRLMWPPPKWPVEHRSSGLIHTPWLSINHGENKYRTSPFSTSQTQSLLTGVSLVSLHFVVTLFLNTQMYFHFQPQQTTCKYQQFVDSKSGTKVKFRCLQDAGSLNWINDLVYESHF